MNVLLIILRVIHTLVTIGLVFVVMSQESKMESLGGSFGGGSSSSYRGRMGREQYLQKLTMYLAVAFFVLSALLFFVQSRM
jgi:preprotein translocase subunit SecG